MHNLDRTQLETWEDEFYPSESYAYEGEAEQDYEMGGQWYGEEEGEWYGEADTEWSDEEGWNAEEEGEWYGEDEEEWSEEAEGDLYGEMDGYGEVDEGEISPEMPFSEAEEMTLAAELLAVDSEEEFDQFLNKLFSASNRGRRRRRGSGGIFGNLGGLLKNFARKALPIAGTALGNVFAPGIGGLVGGQLASGAGSMFGLETEGMSPEDEQFEVARRYVRMAGAASQEASMAPPSAPAESAAQQALLTSAQQHAPGLLAGSQPSPAQYRGRSRKRGVWTRRGNMIILHGLFKPRGGRR